MKAQHTPGPWSVGEVDVYNDGSNLPPEIGLWVNGSRWDKIVGSVTIGEGDARLIAAAPELLAALEALVGSDNADSIDDRYENARQAIIKATGAA